MSFGTKTLMVIHYENICGLRLTHSLAQVFVLFYLFPLKDFSFFVNAFVFFVLFSYVLLSNSTPRHFDQTLRWYDTLTLAPSSVQNGNLKCQGCLLGSCFTETWFGLVILLGTC